MRHLRILYALPDEVGERSLYDRTASRMILEAHEYICPQRLLGQFTLPAMQRFLKRMAPDLTRFR